MCVVLKGSRVREFRAEGERKGSEREVDGGARKTTAVRETRGKKTRRRRRRKRMRERRMPRCGSVSSSIILEDSKGWSQRRNPRVAGTSERRRRTRVRRGEGWRWLIRRPDICFRTWIDGTTRCSINDHWLRLDKPRKSRSKSETEG